MYNIVTHYIFVYVYIIPLFIYSYYIFIMLYNAVYSDWLRTWRQVHLEKSRKVPFTKVRGHNYDPYMYTEQYVGIYIVLNIYEQ